MTPEHTLPGDDPTPDHSMKRAQHAAKRTKKSTTRKKPGHADPPARPACIVIKGQGSCPEWEHLLAQYPMIDSVQREDFPDQGASFAYLAHFYCTGDTAEESSRAQKEFKDFFRAIGYTYDYSGNFESRWYEGIGIQIR